jgi:thioredoxin-like negative regulator of GroEL
METATPPFDPDAPPERPVDLPDGDALDAFVDAHDRAVVQFYTEGCSLCAAMDTVLGAVPRETDAVAATINPRDDPPLIESFRITSVPTLVLFVDGEPVDRIADGFVSGEELLAFVESVSADAGV